MAEADRKKRGAPRVPYSQTVTIVDRNGRAGDGKLRNLSVDGAAAEVSIDLREQEHVTLRVPDIGIFEGVVRRSMPPTVNIQFQHLSLRDKEAIADFLQVRRILFGE